MAIGREVNRWECVVRHARRLQPEQSPGSSVRKFVARWTQQMAVAGLVVATLLNRLLMVVFRSTDAAPSEMLALIVRAFADSACALTGQFLYGIGERHCVSLDHRAHVP